jgi:hypothetical protein
MADGFDERMKAAENKWAHDEAMRFKVMARRNKLLGLWAAGEMGIGGAESDVYAKEVVKADFEEAGDEDVFRKVRQDFDAKKVAASDDIIRKKMDELLTLAGDQVMAEKP